MKTGTEGARPSRVHALGCLLITTPAANDSKPINEESNNQRGDPKQKDIVVRENVGHVSLLTTFSQDCQHAAVFARPCVWCAQNVASRYWLTILRARC